MIKKNTVLILGAGASKPCGFPLGSELRDQVLKLNWIFSHYFQEGFTYDDVKLFNVELRTSGYSSVDAFLENRTKWENIGKLAIARCLLLCEKKAKLFPPDQPKDHWYECLWQKLSAPTWNEFRNNRIDIITFNYDRSLESYLYHVIHNHYAVKIETAAKALPILHVHGHLGPFSQYAESSPEHAISAAHSIKIVHEESKTTMEFKKADEVLGAAENIYFIGFGYSLQNMKKFSMFKKRREASFTPKILGTHKGISATGWEDICYQFGISRWLNKRNYGGSISRFMSDLL